MSNRRIITIGVLLPCSVTCEVEEHDDDLTIKSIRRIDCNASARTVSEQLDEDSLDDMRKAFDRAKP